MIFFRTRPRFLTCLCLLLAALLLLPAFVARANEPDAGAGSSAAVTFLSGLSEAETGISMNDYSLSSFGSLLDDWFYIVNATSSSPDKEDVQFFIAKDLSAVYSLRSEGVTLVYGSAQEMMDYEYTIDTDEGQVKETVVRAILPDVQIGSQAPVTVRVPANLPYSITVESSNLDVASVDEDGQLIIHKAGEALISGTITVNNASKDYSVLLTVDGPIINMEVPDSLFVGEVYNIIAEVAGVSDSPEIVFSTDDNDVIRIEGTRIVALKAGEARIYAGTQEDIGAEDIGAVVLVVNPTVYESKPSSSVLLIILAIVFVLLAAVMFVLVRRLKSSRKGK
ncbi:hypothetical protein LJC42_04360 [Eubacteriales bacterium OttesenSCG-928-K08]|nr:hypothetical protein [Eubacteriales bacterium OttesenSCG-928-K08]